MQGFSGLFEVEGKDVKEPYLDYLWNLLMRPMGDVDRIDTLGVISVYYIMCDAKIEDKVSNMSVITNFHCHRLNFSPMH